MKCRVVIMPDGTVQVFVDEGSFAEASAKVQQLLTQMGVVDAGPVEQHRHGPDEVHVHSHTHAEAGNG
jgi:hypothetical protein